MYAGDERVIVICTIGVIRDRGGGFHPCKRIATPEWQISSTWTFDFFLFLLFLERMHQVSFFVLLKYVYHVVMPGSLGVS